ncbi:MAG: response regulator transcription factor [Clostridia bacterium]|nr:response regulator transcription factor [Clostridia bacterium]MBQ9212156.1 response regulator transcription factor [Clostridia bacterium]
MQPNQHCKILIIEDDPGISNFIKTAVNAAGYMAIVAESGKTALQMISSHCPDCILLDLGLPDMDGREIIRSVRSWTQTPIIVISARSMEEDKAAALDDGADDYVTKPFGTVELLARIRTALRHTRTTAESNEIGLIGTYHVGGLEIDYKKMRVLLDGSEVHLTPNEFRIVALLGKHAGRVMTYKAMLQELWGPSASMDNKILRVHMASIRRKIEPDPNEPRYIFTEVGVGYRMAENEEKS